MNSNGILRLRWLGLLVCLLFLIGCGQFSAETPARILYLSPDENANLQLFLLESEGSEPQQLTSAEFGVFDFFPAPDGSAISLAWNSSQFNTEIWTINIERGTPQPPEQLLSCVNFICQNPIWASDSRRIIFERRSLAGDEPRLWWLDSETGETIAVFNDEKVAGYFPRLSPDDKRLSFVFIPDPTDPAAMQLPPGHNFEDGHNHTPFASQQVAIYNFETGERVLIPNLMNSQARWRPGDFEPQILFTDMQFFGERFGVHLLHATVDGGNVRDITDGRLLEDASPSWSPDGTRVAFTRKEANTPMGRQLWMMEYESGDARALTANADWHHGEPQWSADASSLLFQRFDTTRQNAVPGVWRLDLESGTEVELAGHGIRPKWLP